MILLPHSVATLCVSVTTVTITSASSSGDGGLAEVQRYVQVARDANDAVTRAVASVDSHLQSAVASMLAKLSAQERRLETLITRNKAAGEPDDDATEQISVALECVSLAKNLQQMMEKSPDLLEVCVW